MAEPQPQPQPQEEQVEQEWQLFKRRLGPLLTELTRNRDAVIRGFRTTDPDFDPAWLEPDGATSSPGEAGGVDWRIELPAEYPGQSPVVRVLSKHPIADWVQPKINEFLQANQGKLCLRPMVKWIDRVIGSWRPPTFSAPSPGPTQETFVAPPSREPAEEPQAPMPEDAPLTPESQWTLRDQLKLERALQQFPKSMNKRIRWRKIAKAVPRKSKKECVARFEHVRQTLRRREQEKMAAFREQRKREEEEDQRQKQRHHDHDDALLREDVDQEQQQLQEQQQKQEDQYQSSEWSQVQQAALDRALADYPASMDKNERWKAIARAVPAKSKRECVQRFKQIREELKVKQQAEEEGTLLPDLNPAERGVRGSLDGLSMVNAGFLFADAVKLLCSCAMCHKDITCQVERAEPYNEWCSSCSAHLRLDFHPALVHEQSQGKLGFFDATSLVIQDFLSADLRVSCFECGSLVRVKDVQRARSTECNCHQCHARIRFIFQGWSSVDLDADKQERYKPKGVATAAAAHTKGPRIVPGGPLPEKGACKHYKRSHRWLRFPCCGVAFPCDVCHEEQSSCSEAKWATRQICGFCSTEQPYGSKPCLKCGKDIGGSTSSTGHWEGGKGCRDKVLMSNKDSKKFANSKLKTRSNKAARVGPKNNNKTQQ